MQKHFEGLLKTQEEAMKAGFKEEADLLKEQLNDAR